MRIVIIATIAVLSSLVTPPAGRADTTMALPDCVGQPHVRPTEVVFACADGNFSANNLSWTGWGEMFAAAVGTAEVNDCTPYCAAGHFHSYPIVVVAKGKQSCPNGQSAYAEVVYAFIGKSPYPNASEANSTYPFKCGPRQ